MFTHHHFVGNALSYFHYTTEQQLKDKIPELEKSLTLIQSLLAKKTAGETSGTVRYNLTDNVYAKADVDYQANVVNLWLGANVMLEYTYEEAIDFLTQNQTKALSDLETVGNDLALVRDQVVTSEVNMSRIYNWSVRQKRKEGGEKQT